MAGSVPDRCLCSNSLGHVGVVLGHICQVIDLEPFSQMTKHKLKHRKLSVEGEDI